MQADIGIYIYQHCYIVHFCCFITCVGKFVIMNKKYGINKNLANEYFSYIAFKNLNQHCCFFFNGGNNLIGKVQTTFLCRKSNWYSLLISISITYIKIMLRFHRNLQVSEDCINVIKIYVL